MAVRLKPALLLVYPSMLLLALLVQTTPAHAKAFKVNTTLDAPDANPGNGKCATASGACTLRAAVMEANGLAALRAGKRKSSRNRIKLRAGTYTLTVTGKGEDNAATGDLDLNGGALTIKGTGRGRTIIDGNQHDRIFHLGPATPNQFSLSRVTIQNGSAVSNPPSTSSAGPDVGGGIRIEQNSGLEVKDALFQHNQAGARGGAIGMPPGAAAGARTRYHELGADPTINTKLTKVTMRQNSAGVEGGAMFNNRDAFLRNVVIEDNRVTGASIGFERGGGIAQSGDLSLTDVIISGNTIAGGNPMRPGNGAGIANRGDPNAMPFPIFGRIRLSRVTVSNNSVPGGLGGGVATGFGTTAILTNVTISGNQSSSGGGFVNGGGASLMNVTLSGNSAPAGGGVVTVRPPNPQGAPNSETTLRNTILNRGPVGTNCFAPGPPFRPPASAGDNISSDNSCNLTGPGDRNGTDPLLAALADNGGFTPTHALLPGSPAIDAVLNNACPPPATDQRDVKRPQGARCDIGAYEHED